MSTDTLISLCWIVLGLTALVNVGGAAMAYQPESGFAYVLSAGLPVLVIAAVLFALPRSTGATRVVALAIAVVLGGGLTGTYGYRLMVDSGNSIFWLPQVLLGLGLLLLSYQIGRDRGLEGKT